VKGTRPGKLPPPSQTHEDGRVCQAPGCDTKLSRYNEARFCWQHSDAVFPNYRGKRLQPGRALR
jgi:hypothetical protein